MSVQTFECIPGTYGKRIDNRNIVVTGPGLSTLQKKLTVINKAVVYELNRLRKAQNNNPARHDSLQKQIDELTPDRFVEYWCINQAGEFLIPSGFWYLIDSMSIENIPPTITPIIPSHARDYQREAIETALKLPNCFIELATGLGKTLIISSICESLVAAGKRVCVIVPTIQLVGQTVNQMKHLNVSGAGGPYKFKLGSDVLVSTPITANSYIGVWDALLIDEAAHTSAETWFRLGLNAIKAQYRYGFSACPSRGDGLEAGIHAWLGPIVISRNASWGIENKWLTPVDITRIDIKLKSTVSAHLMAAVAYKIDVQSRLTLYCIYQIVKKCVDRGDRIMLLLRTIKGGETLAKFCAARGIDVQVAHAQYKAPFFWFKEGKTKILCGTDKLLGEGIDVPNVDCVINVCNIASESTTLQILGRGVRLFPGKEICRIIDIYFGNYEPFERAAKSRKKVYETITDKVKMFSFSEKDIKGE